MPRRSQIFRNSNPPSHFIEVCLCGVVVGWCRCHGPDARPPVVEVRESKESCDDCERTGQYADLEWRDVWDSGLKVPNPPPAVRPVTLALDLVEVKHQAGMSGGRTILSPESWYSIFYRGEDAKASQSAMAKAFERWKSAVRSFGLACGMQETERGAFCVNMGKALPWAERVLEESERRAEERRKRSRSAPAKVAANEPGVQR